MRVSGGRSAGTKRSAEQRQQRRDGDVEAERPAPAERLDDHAADQRPEGDAEAGAGAPDADRPRAGDGVLVGRRDDRQRGGQDQRRAEPLDDAGGDQQARAPRRGRSASEPTVNSAEAGEQRPPAPVAVARDAARDQQRREDEHVGVDDPQLRDRAGAEVVAQGRQGDRDQVRVGHAEDLRGDEDGEERQAGESTRARRGYGTSCATPSMLPSLSRNQAARSPEPLLG